MSRPRYTAGDRIVMRGVVKIQASDDAAPVVDTSLAGAVVKGALVRPDRSALATGTAVVAGSVIDAPTGVIECVFSSASTGSIVAGLYLFECQITPSGGEPFTLERLEVEIESGLIP